MKKFKKIIALLYRERETRVEFEFFFGGCEFSACLSIAEHPYQLIIGTSNKKKGDYGAIMEVRPVGVLWISDEDFTRLKKYIGAKGIRHMLDKEALYRVISEAYPDKIVHDDAICDRAMKSIIRDRNSGAITDEFLCFRTLHTGNPQDENLARTEKHFGKEIREFCKRNRVSSCWKHEIK